MKKKVTAIFLCVALLAIAIVGASLAYFTDSKSATNTFTVGNVKIELIESRYHREGYNGTSDKDIPKPTASAEGMDYVTDGKKIHTDEEIREDAKSYQNYLNERGQNMVPGYSVAKRPYVINTGKNDAYIRIRVMVPTKANRDYWRASSGGVISSQFCTTAITSGEFMHGGRDDYPIITDGDSAKGYVDENGVRYDIYTFVRNEPLKPGEMTEWNVWNFIGLDKSATSDDIQKAVEAGAIKVTETDGGAKTMTFNVLVEADAIQAEGFADATAAFAAFDK